MQQYFDYIDTNSDGFIDAKEWPSAAADRRKQMEGGGGGPGGPGGQ